MIFWAVLQASCGIVEGLSKQCRPQPCNLHPQVGHGKEAYMIYRPSYKDTLMSQMDIGFLGVRQRADWGSLSFGLTGLTANIEVAPCFGPVHVPGLPKRPA